MAAECKYKDFDRCLTWQCTDDLNDDCMITEIISELTTINNMNSITSDQALLCMRRARVQRGQTAILKNLKDNKEFDTIKS